MHYKNLVCATRLKEVSVVAFWLENQAGMKSAQGFNSGQGKPETQLKKGKRP